MIEKQLKKGQTSVSKGVDCLEQELLEGEVEALARASDDDLSSTTLLQVLQAFLALDGRAFSIGALRDLGDPTEAKFSPKSAVDALGQIGYKSSLGQMKPSRVKSTHCPLIAFTKTGEAVLVEQDDELSSFKVTSFWPSLKQTYLKSQELNFQIENFVILAKKTS